MASSTAQERFGDNKDNKMRGIQEETGSTKTNQEKYTQQANAHKLAVHYGTVVGKEWNEIGGRPMTNKITQHNYANSLDLKTTS